MDCCYPSADAIFASTLDGDILSFVFFHYSHNNLHIFVIFSVSVSTGKAESIGKHTLATKCINYSPQYSFLTFLVALLLFHLDLVLSGSWDRTIAFWDPRSSSKTAQYSATVSDKVYCMDSKQNKLVYGLANGKVLVYDIRERVFFSFIRSYLCLLFTVFPQKILENRDSPLKYHMRTISINNSNTGYAIAGIEGRVGIEFFHSNTAEASPEQSEYVFKCHRRTVDGKERIFPINSIIHHPVYGTFATGGCDGIVNVWDGDHRKRLVQFPAFQTRFVFFNHRFIFWFIH